MRSAGLELVHADARDLPFDPGTFDVVVSNLAIHNIAGYEGKDRAVQEAVRVLRPGGWLRIVDFRAGHYIEPLQAAGCQDVELRRLDWRICFGIPGKATGLVTARKQAGPAGDRKLKGVSVDCAQ